MEVTTARIDQMIKTCDEAGVMLAGIFPRRFNPSTEIFQRAIVAGLEKWYWWMWQSNGGATGIL